MTLAAVMRCEGGIVMCADSQESVGDYHYPVEKLVTASGPWESIAIAGSGRAGIVDMVAEQLSVKLQGGYDDASYYEDKVRDILTELYRNEISVYPASDDEKLVEMLVALHSRKHNHLVVLKCEATAVSRVREFEIIGAGRAVRYELEELWKERMPIRQGVVAAIHLLRTAKTALHIVGGKGSIATLSYSGDLRIESDWNTFDLDKYLWAIRRHAGSLSLKAGDLTISTKEMKEALRDFESTVLRAHKKVNEAAEMEERIKRLLFDGNAIS